MASIGIPSSERVMDGGVEAIEIDQPPMRGMFTLEVFRADRDVIQLKFAFGEAFGGEFEAVRATLVRLRRSVAYFARNPPSTTSVCPVT
jgi:hypothetical protein